MIPRLTELEVDFTDRIIYKRPLRVMRSVFPAYWRYTIMIFAEWADVSIYYSMLGRIATAYKVTRQFVEMLIVRAFASVACLYESAKNIILLDIDKVLDLDYHELCRLVARWSRRRSEFETYWANRMLYAGSPLTED